MAQVWMPGNGEIEWEPVTLDATAYGLAGSGLSPLDDPGHPNGDAAFAALLVQSVKTFGEQWLLLARSKAMVQVNGLPLVLGVRLLCDRDEITVRSEGADGALRCYFSTEPVAQVTVYPGGDGAIKCPRCKRSLESGCRAVRCPNANCRAWYHQEAPFECFTYGANCTLCEAPTEMNASSLWSPEEL
jgi:hypothetical protein